MEMTTDNCNRLSPEHFAQLRKLKNNAHPLDHQQRNNKHGLVMCRRKYKWEGFIECGFFSHSLQAALHLCRLYSDVNSSVFGGWRKAESSQRYFYLSPKKCLRMHDKWENGRKTHIDVVHSSVLLPSNVVDRPAKQRQVDKSKKEQTNAVFWIDNDNSNKEWATMCHR